MKKIILIAGLLLVASNGWAESMSLRCDYGGEWYDSFIFDNNEGEFAEVYKVEKEKKKYTAVPITWSPSHITIVLNTTRRNSDNYFETYPWRYTWIIDRSTLNVETQYGKPGGLLYPFKGEGTCKVIEIDTSKNVF